jgi:hypothetical protein
MRQQSVTATASTAAAAVGCSLTAALLLPCGYQLQQLQLLIPLLLLFKTPVTCQSIQSDMHSLC